MEPQARYTVVGAAVLLLAALAAGVAVWLLRSGNGPDVRLYTVYFARQSLAGVQENGEVLMKGLRVGTVRQFAFSNRHAGTVEMVLELDANAPVRASSRAVIDRNLITGAASVDLVTTDESSPRLLRVPAGEAHPVITEGESDVEQFRQTVTQLGQRADEALQRVSATLSAGNRAALADTLVAIGRAAQALEATTRQASGDLHRLADRYDQLGAQAGSRLDDASAVVQQVGGDVARLARRAEGVAENADIELRVTGEKVRSAADAFADTSRGLGNPRALLFGPPGGSLGPGEEMP
ncbi:MAG: ABC-type transport system periplasmic component [Ramlibacter sp.]|nr:ABC-type transport system periplasmic component [Ramlibacter sp.]